MPNRLAKKPLRTGPSFQDQVPKFFVAPHQGENPFSVCELSATLDQNLGTVLNKATLLGAPQSP